MSICSNRTRSRKLDIVEKTLHHNSNPYISQIIFLNVLFSRIQPEIPGMQHAACCVVWWALIRFSFVRRMCWICRRVSLKSPPGMSPLIIESQWRRSASTMPKAIEPNSVNLPKNKCLLNAYSEGKTIDWSGIRTHAPEETRALRVHWSIFSFEIWYNDYGAYLHHRMLLELLI